MQMKLTTKFDFFRLTEIKVFQEGETRIAPFYDFDKAGLHPVMRRNVDLAGYKVPTPIQMYCLPAIIQGHDVMGIAQTGTHNINKRYILCNSVTDILQRLG